MKIGFDAKRLFNNFTGLGNYSRSLVTNIQKVNSTHEYVLYSPRLSENTDAQYFINNPSFQIQNSSKLFWRERGIIKDLKKDGINIYHGLSHEIPMGIQHTKVKSVVTIHDLIFKIYPKTYNFFDTKIYDFKFKYACNHSNKIIAISESTKNDIIKFYGIDPQKIEVIYQACNPLYYKSQSESQVQQVLQQYQLPQNFLLYVGSIIERKNLLTIVKAHEQLNDDVKIPLVIIGKGGKYKELVKEYIQSKGIKSDFIWLDNLVDNTHLQAIYQQTKAFIYPSVYEGFGIPVVEALLSKTPVITSNTSSLPEAAGPNSICIDPSNVDLMKESIEKVLTNSILSQDMIEKGYQYAMEKFDAEKLAKQLLQFYQKL